MKIHEYQAKEILARYGVAVPKGEVANTLEEANAVARKLFAEGASGVVVKAQIHAGGRGKGGGVSQYGMIIALVAIIIVFQIFFKNKYYTDYTALWSFPFGINIYAQSVEFAWILAVKFLICISFIILLSSTTKLQDLLQGASRLGLPAEIALALGMMIRYLFVFGYIFRKINETLKTKCFDAFDHHLPYRYRLRQLGYTIGTMFIRSYEQGERVYTSMLCRGYGRDSHLFITKKPLLGREWAFLSITLIFVIAVPVTVWLTAVRLF